jgi:hypothetical protein
MPIGLYDSVTGLMQDGEKINLTLTKLDDTTIKLSWNPIIAADSTYDGILVTLSERPINPSNYPTDGVKYTASDNWLATADSIGAARVVAATYGDHSTNKVIVQNVDPDATYYASAHAVSGVLQYYHFGVRSYVEDLQTQAYPNDIPKTYGPPTDPTIGQVYYDLDSKSVLMWNGAAWIPAGNGTTRSGKSLPVSGSAVGEFFYIAKSGDLYVWTGSEWKKANVDDSAKRPIYSKTGIGTDDSYDERRTLINILKGQLGWPKLCVELDETQFNIAIDNALQELRRRAESAYKRRFFSLRLKPNQQIYYLNNPEDESDKVVDVIAVRRTRGLGMGSLMGGDNGIYGQIFSNLFYNAGQIDLVSIHLTASQMEAFSMLFAGEVVFNWNETRRELRTYKTVMSEEWVLVETSIERTEQELLQDRWTTQWIQNWSLAECRIILGMIRGKYQSLPGVGGSLSLNGSELIQIGQTEQTDLLRQISDFEVGNLGEFGNTQFLMG